MRIITLVLLFCCLTAGCGVDGPPKPPLSNETK